VRYREISPAIAIEVGESNGGSRFPSESGALVREAALSYAIADVIEPTVVSRSIREHHVREGIPIQVTYAHVAGRPFRAPEVGADLEMPVTVVEVDKVGVGVVVADDHIQVSVAVHVDE
jgi:hypothetical protein